MPGNLLALTDPPAPANAHPNPKRPGLAVSALLAALVFLSFPDATSGWLRNWLIQNLGFAAGWLLNAMAPLSILAILLWLGFFGALHQRKRRSRPGNAVTVAGSSSRGDDAGECRKAATAAGAPAARALHRR